MTQTMTADRGFLNTSELVFDDVSAELWREYRFADGNVVRIENPLKLNVSSSGGHRLYDAQGQSHYIPVGWIHLVWETKPGEPNFVR